MFGQLINLLDKGKIAKISRENGGERYIKKFDVWQHLAIMLYAVIKRYDSLREIAGCMLPEARKLAHLGISVMPKRSTLSDANARRPECVFEAVYRDLYERYRKELSSDSRGRRTAKWMKRLQILDSTTITLFSNLIFKGARRRDPGVQGYHADALTVGPADTDGQRHAGHPLGLCPERDQA